MYTAYNNVSPPVTGGTKHLDAPGHRVYRRQVRTTVETRWGARARRGEAEADLGSDFRETGARGAGGGGEGPVFVGWDVPPSRAARSEHGDRGEREIVAVWCLEKGGVEPQ